MPHHGRASRVETPEEHSNSTQQGQPRPSRQDSKPMYTPLVGSPDVTEHTLPLYDFTQERPRVRAAYIRDVDHANSELSALLAAAAKPWGSRVAGLDCEWRPNFSPGPESPVALVQIALGRTILLLQVSAMKGKRFVLQLFFLTRKLKPVNRISFGIKNTVGRPYHT